MQEEIPELPLDSQINIFGNKNDSKIKTAHFNKNGI